MRALSCMMLCVMLSLAAGCDGIDRVLKPDPPPAPPKPQASASPPEPRQFVEAFTRLNRAFQQEYERILGERGTRAMRASRGDAFDAMHAVLVRLGMIVESRDPEAGTLTVAAPAPRPLTADEWRRTVEADLPMMAGILCPILGPYCATIKFEPDDYVIVINVTILAMANGESEIALTTRMREIVPRPGVPRRDYPPPTAVRMALDKIWTRFDQELLERRRRPERAPR